MQKMIVLALSLISSSGYALSFSHLDWEMACDNTHTCRMAGYQADTTAPVSILLSYPAGTEAQLTGRVQLLDAPPQAYLTLNAQPYGVLQFHNNQADLTAKQLQQLLVMARKNTRIELRHATTTWRVSDRGLTAVLLKADEYQKRVGTSSALLAKGIKSSRQVRRALALPSSRIHNYRRAKAQHYALNSKQAKALAPRLKQATNSEDCPLLWQTQQQTDNQLSIYPINAKQVLVERPCWQAAYNFGAGMWVMDKNLSTVQQLVTTSGTSFSAGQIFSYQKGRGLGDCLSIDEWAFTGQRFKPSYHAVSLQCKGFQGGAWKLPTLITQVSH